jgi:hypothetical protein
VLARARGRFVAHGAVTPVGLAVVVLVGVTTAHSVVHDIKAGGARTPSTHYRSWGLACGGRFVGERLGRQAVCADHGRAMTTFNIGGQNAGWIQNVGGDMVVQDGTSGKASVHVFELRDRLAQLREEIDGLALPAESHAVASEALAEAQAEAAAPAPRSRRIAHSLRRVTETLNDAGALASAAVNVGRVLASAVSLVALLAYRHSD